MFKQRQITAHMAQLKATLVNNASCSSDLSFRKVKKTGFILAFMRHNKNLQRGSSQEILLREVSTWHRAGPHRDPRLLETLGTAWMCVSLGCFSQTEQQNVTATKCSRNQSTKEVKLPHWKVQTFGYFPCSTSTDTSPETPTSNICLQGPSAINWPSSPCCLNQVSKSRGQGPGTVALLLRGSSEEIQRGKKQLF